MTNVRVFQSGNGHCSEPGPRGRTDGPRHTNERVPPMKLPSPAMFVSIAALTVALGGTSYAAVTINGSQIKAKSINSSKIAKNTLGSGVIKDGKIKAKDLAAVSSPPSDATARPVGSSWVRTARSRRSPAASPSLRLPRTRQHRCRRCSGQLAARQRQRLHQLRRGPRRQRHRRLGRAAEHHPAGRGRHCRSHRRATPTLSSPARSASAAATSARRPPRPRARPTAPRPVPRTRPASSSARD